MDQYNFDPIPEDEPPLTGPVLVLLWGMVALEALGVAVILGGAFLLIVGVVG